MNLTSRRGKLLACLALAFGFVAAVSAASAEGWYYINRQPASLDIAQVMAARGLPFGYYWLQPNGNWGFEGNSDVVGNIYGAASEPVRAGAFVLPGRIAAVVGRIARAPSSRRTSIKPLLRGEAARLVPLVRRHPFLGDAEGPDMAFRVAGAIGAVAVELRLRLLQDLRARFARAFAMRVDVLALRELDVDGLRVLAADGFRTFVVGAPLVADHDDGIPEGHLRMREIAVGIEKDEERFEAERFFQPAKGRLRILVAHGARQPFGAVGVSHVDSLSDRCYLLKTETFVTVASNLASAE
jgi:hypothetical protein